MFGITAALVLGCGSTTRGGGTQTPTGNCVAIAAAAVGQIDPRKEQHPYRQPRTNAGEVQRQSSCGHELIFHFSEAAVGIGSVR